MTRLILDVSSLVRWTGPPVGIARVEAALAAAVQGREGAELAVWDQAAGGYRTLLEPWADRLLGWDAAFEPVAGPEPVGWRRVVPSRLPMVAGLERIRLTAPAPVAEMAGLVQGALLAIRPHTYPWRDPTGQRVANVPPDLALGAVLALGPGDIVLSAGVAWSHTDAGAVAALKQQTGFRFATLCYDLIPLTHPAFFTEQSRADFERHWRIVLGFADLVLVNADCIAADVARLATAPVRTVRVPLGRDPPLNGVEAPLPPGLVAGRFALFVSTIEPRKNHALLLRVWRRLLARGVPQAHEFALVFVGRPGWMVDDVLADLADPPPGLHHLAHVDDATLAALYRGAAFGLYPSHYEGFGLPVIEAFGYGKAVIISTGGALPQTAAGRALALDPDDDAGWEAALEAWITDPGARAPFQARIQAAPADPLWPEAAGAIFDTVLTTLPAARAAPDAPES